MDKKRKVGFATKLLSNRMYLNEVSVEGKTNDQFNFKIGYYDLYAAQIIRIGNCITLPSNTLVLDKNTFWNTNYFEDLTRYVFWTFNKSFLITLKEAVNFLPAPSLNRCSELLRENFTPYDDKLEEQADEELYWCLVKNGHLKQDSKFSKIYDLDKENRTSLLQTLIEKIAALQSLEKDFQALPEENVTVENKKPSFVDMLKAINESSEETLQFIISKLAEAEFNLDIFSKVAKLPNHKNPYGLNGAIAAMIDFFYQHNYFKKEYNIEEIFNAYLAYTDNSIGKLKGFISKLREDNSYIKHFNKLKQLKINKLK